jgi:TolA-binding protein
MLCVSLVSTIAEAQKRKKRAEPAEEAAEPAVPAEEGGGEAAPAPAAGGDQKNMKFDMKDTGQAAAPPAEGPPSEALANALRLYQEERHQEAAVQLQRIVEGETQDAPGNQQKAQFFLGKSLYHLRYYQSALAVFDEISQMGKGHLFFDQTLQWLAQLASQLPEPAGIIEKVGRYDISQIEQFNNEEGEQFYAQLLFLLGRSKYAQGEFEPAIELFEQVPSSSRWYVNAKMFAGITHVRLRQARPAIASFRAIIEALESGDLEEVEEEERMRDLAWLSLARVYYTAANRVDDETGERNVDGALLGGAVDAWSRIDTGSEYWLDALFEGSYAFFLADEFSRSLGNIHTLFSPYFEDSYYPEALVLKAVVFFYNCQMQNASAMVAKFHERYDPVQDELQKKLGEFKDNESFYKFLTKVREGEGNLSPAIRGVVATALSDRTVLRHLEYVKQLDAEEGRLKESPAAFKSASVGARILQDIALAKSFAIDQTGDLARGRYTRLIQELQDLMNQIDAVDLEVATFERGQLTQEMQAQQITADRAGGGQVEVDEEHQVWPFDGEYWRDELGFYRQEVTSKCGR